MVATWALRSASKDAVYNTLDSEGVPHRAWDELRELFVGDNTLRRRVVEANYLNDMLGHSEDPLSVLSSTSKSGIQCLLNGGMTRALRVNG